MSLPTRYDYIVSHSPVRRSLSIVSRHSPLYSQYRLGFLDDHHDAASITRSPKLSGSAAVSAPVHGSSAAAVPVPAAAVDVDDAAATSDGTASRRLGASVYSCARSDSDAAISRWAGFCRDQVPVDRRFAASHERGLSPQYLCSNWRGMINESL